MVTRILLRDSYCFPDKPYLSGLLKNTSHILPLKLSAEQGQIMKPGMTEAAPETPGQAASMSEFLTLNSPCAGLQNRVREHNPLVPREP